MRFPVFKGYSPDALPLWLTSNIDNIIHFDQGIHVTDVTDHYPADAFQRITIAIIIVLSP